MVNTWLKLSKNLSMLIKNDLKKHIYPFIYKQYTSVLVEIGVFD